HQYWQLVGHLPVAEAIGKLEKRSENAAQGFTLFSISIQKELLGWTGPIATLFFLLYLAVHLHHLEKLSQPGNRALKSFPWIGLFRDPATTTLNVTTLFLLPVIANASLVWRTSAGASRYAILTVVIGALLSVQMKISGMLCRIRSLNVG